MFNIGTQLYYVHKYSGDLCTVVVDFAEKGHFYFYYAGKLWRGGPADVGTRLFLTAREAVKAYNIRQREAMEKPERPAWTYW